MKNILKYLIVSVFLVSIISCDNEDQTQLVISQSGSGAITAPESGSAYILNPLEDLTNTAFTLTWNAADYNVPTEIKYTVEFAKAGTDFAEPFTAGTTTNLYLSWNVTEFNGASVGAGLPPFVEGQLEARVLSTIGSKGVETQTSEPITILVTPYTTDLPKIAVPGFHQDWSPKVAPLLASSGFGETDYEGFVWLSTEGGDAEGFKFLAPKLTGGFDWGTTDWADDGTNTGKLVAEDEVNCKVPNTGYYLVKADTKKLTYATQAMSWGIIGGSIPGTGWSEDLDMTYDKDSKTLKITLDFVNPASDGGIKFRPNNDWAGNLGDKGADGSLEVDGDNIQIPESGNYTVTLDLSNPRKYTYSLVKN